MSTTEAIDPATIICGLKAAVTALECHHNMQLLSEQSPQSKKTRPMYMMIPIEDDVDCCAKKPTKKSKPKKCYETGPQKEACSITENVAKRAKNSENNKPLRDITSTHLKLPQMRGGVLFTKCDCVFRNGLQDNCPLSQCQDKPLCMGKPWPTCPPGQHMVARYPEQFAG